MRVGTTIATLMGAILFIALGLAALRNSSEGMESLAFTLAFAAQAVAWILALTGGGRARAGCAGFAICGSLYLHASLFPKIRTDKGPKLVTVDLARLVQPLAGPIPERRFGPMTALNWSRYTSYHFETIFHCLASVAIGFAGAAWARRLSRPVPDPYWGGEPPG
jgi:hypothetical protein